jgi:hypothetical protein
MFWRVLIGWILFFFDSPIISLYGPIVALMPVSSFTNTTKTLNIANTHRIGKMIENSDGQSDG